MAWRVVVWLGWLLVEVAKLSLFTLTDNIDVYDCIGIANLPKP